MSPFDAFDCSAVFTHPRRVVLRDELAGVLEASEGVGRYLSAVVRVDGREHPRPGGRVLPQEVAASEISQWRRCLAVWRGAPHLKPPFAIVECRGGVDTVALRCRLL